MKSQKVRAVIAFIAAHFATYFIYLAMVGHNGFALHMTQALPYIAISTLNTDFKLRIVSLSTAFAYILIAVNWLILERGIELKIQELFYSSFESIIMTLNLIVILIIIAFLIAIFLSAKRIIKAKKDVDERTYRNDK